MHQNVGSPDRVVRALLATLLCTIILVLNLSGYQLFVALGVALLLLLTVVAAYCPLYALLGLNTLRPRQQ